MNLKSIIVFIFLLLTSLGCASTPTYWDLPTTYQTPSTQEEIQQECYRIRQEIVRQRALASMITGVYAGLAQVKAAQNIAWLENRASNIGCRAAFSSAPSTIDIKTKSDTSLPFDECFKKCKELTKRTNEECFDSCSGR